eukprot:TRINITY_DN1336_c2_g1_i2.p1 TRINITY_DN1336_c2_g1~~TRINITY_DN1336_c2_g1_i2.p1  ORF type:complete len:1437 (-),score=274.97 TRINITY_DN1336_c2_g1_i2:1280-5590(-)
MTDNLASPARRPSVAGSSPSRKPSADPVLRGTLAIFLTKPLQMMAKHNPKKFPQLTEAAKNALALLESNQEYLVSIDKPGARIADPKLNESINKLIVPLQLACQSRDNALMSTALDCLQKMLHYEFIQGSMTDAQSKDRPRKLVERIVEVTCDVFKKAKGERDYPDDSVQLPLIMALVALVVSESCDLHGEAQMHAFKTIFDICVYTKSSIVQTPAKASLDQMVLAIFQRTNRQPIIEPERASPAVERAPTPQLNGAITTTTTTATTTPTTEDSDVEKDDEKEKEKEKAEDKERESDEPGTEQLNGHTDAADKEVEVEEEEQQHDSDAEAKSLPATTNGNGDVKGHHEDKGKEIERGPEENNVRETAAKEIQQVVKDFYALFQTLCELSNEDLTETASQSADSIEVKRKILALELIQTLLRTASPVLRERPEFVQNVIRKYLCPSIGTNGTSPLPRVFQLALSIFLTLVSHFKNNLKEEIGIYFTKIFLKVLESDNSALTHKTMVLQGLLTVCNNPQTLLDIFVNYDLNLQGSDSDIFERMVDDLSGIAKSGVGPEHPHTVSAQSHDTHLKVLGLECLVTIMKSLVDWSKELHVGVTDHKDASQDAESTDEPSTVVTDIAIEEEQRTDSPAPSTNTFASEEFAKKAVLKQHIKIGKQKFNVNAALGVKYLVDHEILEYNPAAIARWIRENPDGLDKKQIGTYFVKGGKRNEFTKEMLYTYLSMIDFRGLTIDLAIRKMLYGFLMLGEEQQVDMVIEGLAARYMIDNPDSIFANADAAYIFAYSIIMLATDLHSIHIPVDRKMSLEQWMRNHKGINDGKDLPEDFQAEAYHRIARTPLKLDEEEEYVSAGLQQRDLRWVSEGKAMTKKVQQLLKQKFEDKKGSTFHSANHIEIVKPMFEVCWCPMLAAFSILLETSTDSKIIDMCLTGFVCAIRVSAIFCMETTRNTFVTSLAKFTNLTNLREIKHKNIVSIKTLITIAHTEGNHLQASWAEVLQCISKLHMMQLHGGNGPLPGDHGGASGVPHSGAGAQGANRPVSTASSQRMPSLAELFGQKPEPAPKLGPSSFEGINAETVAKEIEGVAIDRIFTDTVRLSSTAIVDFVECLCAVSLDEINEPQNPRTFSLQKLVEVADYNMGRIRIVWSSIWNFLGKHFITVGCHKNLDTALYAIDSLKQLATKFLAKDELANYHFQKDFLKPFESIIQFNPSVAVRDMIISCVYNMIHARADNIKSGWKSIFGVLTAAASDNNEKIVRPAFNIVVDIRTKLFELIADSFFVEFVNCLVAFGKNQAYKDISLGAINSLVFCAGQLANGNVCRLKEGGVEQGSFVGQTDSSFSAEDQHIKYWFPILTGFAEVVSHPHIDVRTIALERLFDVFKDYGSMLDGPLWNLVFRGVILPIFVGVRIGINDRPKDESDVWIQTTCMHATQSLVGLVSHFF